MAEGGVVIMYQLSNEHHRHDDLFRWAVPATSLARGFLPDFTPLLTRGCNYVAEKIAFIDIRLHVPIDMYYTVIMITLEYTKSS